MKETLIPLIDWLSEDLKERFEVSEEKGTIQLLFY